MFCSAVVFTVCSRVCSATADNQMLQQQLRTATERYTRLESVVLVIAFVSSVLILTRWRVCNVQAAENDILRTQQAALQDRVAEVCSQLHPLLHCFC